MKLCPKCQQPVAEEIGTCPSCGSKIGAGRQYIDDYRIVEVLHEGYASFLCRAVRQRTHEEAMIRLFTPRAGVDEAMALRLKDELEKLKALPDEGFVRHHSIRKSSDGLWYRISEWIDAENWGSLLASGKLSDRALLFDLFYQMASILAVLHEQGYFIPHLILNDIIVAKDGSGAFKVKIDYKLSRFFDPRLDQPGPMLKRLLSCHPDIINRRPLDFRSDIWSLGKIFVELLTADLGCTDFFARIDELQLPPAAQVLIKVMLADDPDLRPRSMAEVAASLARIKSAGIQKTPLPPPKSVRTPVRMIRGLQKRVRLLAVLVAALLVFSGIFAWFQFSYRRSDVASVLEGYANQYAPSVAFVAVEYWLDAGTQRYYRNLDEGTAFLVDAQGYLLTSRHVVCPWLEDARFLATAQYLRQKNLAPRFGYRMYLWFEGEKAFNRAARILRSSDLADVYFLDTAYGSQSMPRVSIAGVPKPPVQTRQLVTSPLRDDFAVLKIERVPSGLKPLPLAENLNPRRIPKLAPIIALGFPLGSRSQADSVNVSVTSGHVRRSFENLLQIDASVYSGNSGGPIIDTHGKVIGIVSGVAVGMASSPLPLPTPRWNLGMVLPVTRAVTFLKELKAGQFKWNGTLDFSIAASLKKITQAVVRSRWAEARTLADEKLKESPEPALIMATGVMHFCTGDKRGAKRLFSQALSMDAENSEARLMLFLIDWLAGKGQQSAYRRILLSWDWRSAAEFQGYLARVLAGLINEKSALKGWYTPSEKSWLYYVVGLKRARRRQWAGAETLMRAAALAADADTWEFFLTRSKLEQLQNLRRKQFQTSTQWNRYNVDVEAFNQTLARSLAQAALRSKKIAALRAQLASEGSQLKDRRAVLEKMVALEPENKNIILALAFYSAAAEDWPQALAYVQTFLEHPGRQNSDRMSLGLLQAGIFHYQGRGKKARQSLKAYNRRTKDPWHRMISDYLLGRQTEDLLKKQAAVSPENLISAYTPMGFWAEGSGDRQKALKYYKEALGSFLDTWVEYNFARERFKRLKKSTG